MLVSQMSFKDVKYILAWVGGLLLMTLVYFSAFYDGKRVGHDEANQEHKLNDKRVHITVETDSELASEIGLELKILEDAINREKAQRK